MVEMRTLLRVVGSVLLAMPARYARMTALFDVTPQTPVVEPK